MTQMQKCRFISFDKFNNIYKVRHKRLSGGAKVFKTYAQAKNFVKRTLGDIPSGRVQSVTNLLKAMSFVYGRNTPLMPADLQDAVSRHISDSDVLRGDVGAEVLSIMLKYQPVRTAFSTFLRRRKTSTLPAAQAKRLWTCLRSAVLEVSKLGPQSTGGATLKAPAHLRDNGILNAYCARH